MTGKAAAIGTFDGVHLGHAEVLATLRDAASARGLDPVAFTFDRHPLELIAPERAPRAITTTARKEELIARHGVTPVVLPFDEELRRTTAAEWMGILAGKYGVRLLVVGYDNTFGCDGVNLSIADYRTMGAMAGIEVVEAPLVAGISSSAIRKAIAAGDVEGANAMLGRHFMLPGTVVDGNHLGRTIGFPTANVLTLPGLAVPGRGVYAAMTLLPDGSRMETMVNIGVRPTIRRGNETTVEAHVLGWSGDLYGKQISIFFHERMRDEVRFNSIESLKKQLEKDRKNVATALESCKHGGERQIFSASSAKLQK